MVALVGATAGVAEPEAQNKAPGLLPRRFLGPVGTAPPTRRARTRLDRRHRRVASACTHACTCVSGRLPRVTPWARSGADPSRAVPAPGGAPARCTAPISRSPRASGLARRGRRLSRPMTGPLAPRHPMRRATRHCQRDSRAARGRVIRTKCAGFARAQMPPGSASEPLRQPPFPLHSEYRQDRGIL
jgi:hypothetical protein